MRLAAALRPDRREGEGGEGRKGLEIWRWRKGRGEKDVNVVKG